jgi:hypothetical protein
MPIKTASSALTRKRLDWQPTGPGLIADLEQMRYFETDAAAPSKAPAKAAPLVGGNWLN